MCYRLTNLKLVSTAFLSTLNDGSCDPVKNTKVKCFTVRHAFVLRQTNEVKIPIPLLLFLRLEKLNQLFTRTVL